MDDVAYECTVSVRYAFETARKYQEQIWRSRAGFITRKALVGLLLCSLLAGWVMKESGLVAIALATAVILVALVAFDYVAVMAHVFLREPLNTSVRVVLGESGVVIYRGRVGTGLRWKEFIGATAFRDGILLVGSGKSCYWLPESGIVCNDRKTAMQLVRQNVVDFQNYGGEI